MDSLFGIRMSLLTVILLASCGVILFCLVVLGLRNRVMLKLGLRNIPRRRTQTVLIVVGLMLGTLIISAAFGTGDTMTYSFRSLALDSLGEADVLVHTGGSMSLIGPSIMFGNSSDALNFNRVTFFSQSRYTTLSAQVASQQANQDESALLIDGLAPVIVIQEALIVDYTSRQSEGRVSVVGYDPSTADSFGKLRSTSGKQVTLSDLGANEVYLEQGMADRLDAAPGHELAIFLATNKPLQVTVRAVIRSGVLPGSLLMHLAQVQSATNNSDKINAILVSNVGGSYSGAKHSQEVIKFLGPLLKGTSLKAHNDKELLLFAANMIGSVFTTMFVAFGSFSIAAALLLIFLIFIMLAAERTQEMGVARAVGTRRRHLVQMFVYEGASYDLVAALVGTLLGAGVGLATVGVMAARMKNIADISTFQLHHHIEPRSMIVAFCLGLLMTFVTVTISAWRVSRLNIVTAIRDLPPPPHPDAGLRSLWVQQWHYLVDALRQLLHLRLHRTLKRLLWDGPIATLTFLWALAIRGPLTILIGWALLRLSHNGRSAFLFGLGVSLAIIGIGLTIRWILGESHVRPAVRDRIAFSFAGIGLLIFWMLPIDTLRFLNPPSRKSGSEIFILAGIMMIAGAVWAIIYNSDLLLGLLTWLLRPVRRLLPVVRIAVAYPMQYKVRTGLTIAMFALVIFMLVFMSVFTGLINKAMGQDMIKGITGAYDIEAAPSPMNPIPDLSAAIRNKPELNPSDFLSIQGANAQIFSGGEISASGGRYYRIKLAKGVDAKTAARALESAFVENGMTTVVIKDQLEATVGMVRSILGLFQAFMGMGLVVGSASIGIISARAVVERRQQIGMLRAIGYRSWMIQWSFLIEASFVALLGILLGVGLGLILAYNFYNVQIASSGPESGMVFSFSIPWANLIVISAIAYGTSILTTFLPSWQAAHIYPAEALRYE
jgi:putative ABC transport system permease protein